MTKRFVKVGELVTKELPSSEVCMHMKVAGKRMRAAVLPRPPRPGESTVPIMAQLYAEDGRLYSFPITTGEAGFYWDADAQAHYVTEESN